MKKPVSDKSQINVTVRILAPIRGARGADLCWALGDNFQFYSNFALFLTLGGDEPRPRFCSGEQIGEDQKKKRFSLKLVHFFPQSGEDQKKRSSPKMKHFFSPNSIGHLRSDAHQRQIIGGMQM